MRNSGNQEEFSINFSTNKVKITTGGNMFDEKANKPKEEWKTIKANKKYVLDEMYFKWGFLWFIRYSLLFYSKTALKLNSKVMTILLEP